MHTWQGLRKSWQQSQGVRAILEGDAPEVKPLDECSLSIFFPDFFPTPSFLHQDLTKLNNLDLVIGLLKDCVIGMDHHNDLSIH